MKLTMESIWIIELVRLSPHWLTLNHSIHETFVQHGLALAHFPPSNIVISTLIKLSQHQIIYFMDFGASTIYKMYINKEWSKDFPNNVT